MAAEADSKVVALDLLDSAQGHAVQTWRFEGQSIIRIGRSDENDVTIADPRVSRLHAELRIEESGWTLTSLGRNGVLVDGLLITQQQISDRKSFQLGSGGPLIRFREDHRPAENIATLDVFDTSMLEMLQIDRHKKDEEVYEITSGPLFQQLKQRAGHLRRRHQAADGQTGDEDTQA
jgi:pSer/pThr/pTyr-binding forkhead associated (FHA) protein